MFEISVLSPFSLLRAVFRPVAAPGVLKKIFKVGKTALPSLVLKRISQPSNAVC